MSECNDPPLQLNDAVIVEADGDGAVGSRGVVTHVWSSGRYTVTFPDGSFRSLLSKDLRRA